MADASDIALHDILGLHIRHAHGAVQRHFAEHFAALGLTQKQISVMWLTGDNPGITQTELARKLLMDRATTMAIVHALERRALLTRRTAPHDRRRIAFALSEAGRSLLTDARQAIMSHETWLKARFTPDELAMLSTLLRRIYEQG